METALALPTLKVVFGCLLGGGGGFGTKDKEAPVFLGNVDDFFFEELTKSMLGTVTMDNFTVSPDRLIKLTTFS